MTQNVNSVQDAVNMAQKAGEQFKENILKAGENIKPELEKIQAMFQENVSKAQENFQQLQAAAAKQPFNPIEVQSLLFSQQLEALKQFNRQVEGSVEKLHQQFAQFSQNFNKK